MEYIVAAGRLFFLFLNMVGSFFFHTVDIQICTMVKNVIIVTITIILIFVSWVLQALCDYFISHLTCPPSCHQARFSMLLIAIRLKTNYILFTISITRATLSVANPGAGETQSWAGSHPCQCPTSPPSLPVILRLPVILILASDQSIPVSGISILANKSL